VNVDVLLSAVREDRTAADALQATLEREGWSCQSTHAAEHTATAYRALVLLLSRAAIASPLTARDAERAAGGDIPIFPVRLDDAPLSRSLEYFVGSIGAANAMHRGLDAAANEVSAGLRRRLRVALDAARAQKRVVPGPVIEGAPPFRSRPILRRWLNVALSVTLASSVGSVPIEIAPIAGPLKDSAIRGLAQVSAFSGAVCLWLLLVWLHCATRNLLALGISNLRFSARGLLWRLLGFPLNLVIAATALRELLLKTPGSAEPPWLRRILCWSWSPFFSAALLNSSVNRVIGAALTRGMIFCADMLNIFALPALFLLVRSIARRQLNARVALARGQHRQLGGANYAARRLLVAYPASDRSAAEVICEALESHGVDCWLARRDESWRPEAVEGFTAMLIVVSRNLEGSTQTLRELELAVAGGKLILPFRIDRGSVPGAFRFLLGSIQWLDDQASDFDQQIDLAVAAIMSRRSDAGEVTVPLAAEDYKPGQATVRLIRSPRMRVVFNLSAVTYVGLAGIVELAAAALAAVAEQPSAVMATYLLVVATPVRFLGGSLCVAMFFAWRRTSAAPRTWRRWIWPCGFLLSTFGGVGAAATALRGSKGAALGLDLIAAALNIAALVTAWRTVSAFTAAQSRQQGAVEIALSLKGRTGNESVRFAPQTVLQHWIARVGVISATIALLATLMDSGIVHDIARTPEQTRNDVAQVLAMQAVLVLMPVSVLFLLWLAAAFRNLMALGVGVGHDSPRSAVQRFLFPFLNVFVAVPTVARLWRASRPGAAAGQTRALPWILSWWVAVLMYWVALWVRLFENIQPSSALIRADAASCVLFVLAAALTYRVVSVVNALQQLKRMETR
jgi:hypothetical protein